VEVYLDNSATTRPRNEVVDEMITMLKNNYGNPSSLHRKGLEAEKKIKSARKKVSTFLKVREDEVFFTSGGTESNNIAIQGIVNRNKKRGNHLITTKIEHPSVLKIFNKYEEEGFNVSYLNVDEYGIINLKELEESINESTILVSIMAVNNEIGSIQPLKTIKEIINRKNKITKFHVDGVQGIGKVHINIKEIGIDSISFSSHKIHGPKGVGCLYVKKDINLEPIFYGGSQERGIRVGTENVPGIVGFGKAVEILNDKFEDELKHVIKIKEYFIEKVMENIKDTKINSDLEKSAPHIVSLSFSGTRGEILLHYLEERGIYISTRSACSSGKKNESHVLKSIGLNSDQIEGTIRVSFSYSNNLEEVDYVVEKLKESVEEIRMITKR